jgi:hypothetical protein
VRQATGHAERVFAMYKMPAEVINADRPVIMGLSMLQILGLMGGMVIGDRIGNSTVIQIIFAALGLGVLRRGKGLYIAENVFYFIYWFVATRFDLDDGLLDPDTLYDSSRNATSSATYVVRSPDGSKMVVRR